MVRHLAPIRTRYTLQEWMASGPSRQRDLSVQGHYLTQQALTSVGLSADGKTLYAVDPTRGITLLDAATGQAQHVIQGTVHAPWGIEWITN